jgi:hypothetical protein
MNMGKYGAVIGWMNPTTWKSDRAHTKTRVFQPITVPYFPMIVKSLKFAKPQCGWQWLTPHINGLTACPGASG